MQWRYATKKFNPEAIIPDDQWTAIEDALCMSPSSIGLQPWHFIVVKTPELREQLRGASFGQPQVTDASHYVVLCGLRNIENCDVERLVQAKKDILGLSDEDAAIALERYMGYSFFWDSPEKLKSYVESQIHLAAGFVSYAAAEWRVDSCMIGGMVPEKYDEILGLNDTPYRTVLGIAFGYRDSADEHANDPKVRFSKSDLIEYK